MSTTGRNQASGDRIEWETSSAADDMESEIVGAVDLQKKILMEAVEDGTESGRSVCGKISDARDPLGRGFGATVLPGCPLDHRALMHGGGGHDLKAPTLSLLDMSNVVFGKASAIMVIGAERSETMLAPVGQQLGDLQELFQDAVGHEVTSQEEFLAVRESGQVEAPLTAIKQMRQEAGRLFRGDKTPHPEILMSTDAPMSQVTASSIAQAARRPTQRTANIVESLRVIAGTFFSFDPEPVNVNIFDLLIGEVTQAVVLGLFLATIGGRPQSLVRSAAP